VTDWMFNTVAWAQNYDWQGHNAQSRFAAVVQRFTGAILKIKCNAYRLLVCRDLDLFGILTARVDASIVSLPPERPNDFQVAIRWSHCV
jgi:hypothetical protein